MIEAPYTICIVTPNYLSSTPRVVKEADALSRAGFLVRVVFSQGNMEHLRIHDELLISEKTWKYHNFGWSAYKKNERFLFHKSRARHFLMRKLPPALWRLYGVVEMAEGRVYPELAHLAASEPADLFIGHYLDGLAAAAFAARRWNAYLGYDAEDLHTEFGVDAVVKKRAFAIERRYIQKCVHLTAASELMAQHLSEKYNVPKPLAIHNVFPWVDRGTVDGLIKDRRGNALSIYWYSQTIGLDRGIQDAIRAVGLIDAPIQIHLRGALSESVRQSLIALAVKCGVSERVYFHARVPPDELLSRAVEHDIGLATEQPVDISRQISVTNKLFFYLLAGLCLAATDVPGQRQIMETIPEAGYLYPVGNYEALAGILKELIDHPNLLGRKKQAALAAAREQWNWETEQEKLVTAVRAALSDHRINRNIR